jgi:hypothetical protein
MFTPDRDIHHVWAGYHTNMTTLVVWSIEINYNKKIIDLILV